MGAQGWEFRAESPRRGGRRGGNSRVPQPLCPSLAPPSVTGQPQREEEAAGPTGDQVSLLLGSQPPTQPCAPHPTKPPEEDVECSGGEPERELAGLGVGVACWAPATPPGPGGPMCLHADPGALASPLLLLTSVILRAQPAAHQGPRRVRTRPRPSASAFRDRALNAHGRAPVGSAELGTDTGPGLSLHEPGQVPGPPAPPGLRLPFVRRVLGSLYGFQRPLCSKMRDGDQVASFSQSRCVHLTPAPLPGGVPAKVNSWPPQVVPQV